MSKSAEKLTNLSEIKMREVRKVSNTWFYMSAHSSTNTMLNLFDSFSELCLLELTPEVHYSEFESLAVDLSLFLECKVLS